MQTFIRILSLRGDAFFVTFAGLDGLLDFADSGAVGHSRSPPVAPPDTTLGGPSSELCGGDGELLLSLLLSGTSMSSRTR